MKPGWQLVLRSRSPWGPYECAVQSCIRATLRPQDRIRCLGRDTAGDSWFVHFVDRYAYGRVVYLQPMIWSDDDWCIVGIDRCNGDGVGEPVETFRKPASRVPSVVKTPAKSDEFTGRMLGLQWQWPANPQTGWYFSATRRTADCV